MGLKHVESPESKPSLGAKRTLSNKSATRVSTGRIRRNTRSISSPSLPLAQTHQGEISRTQTHTHTHSVSQTHPDKHSICVEHAVCLQLCPRGTRESVWLAFASGTGLFFSSRGKKESWDRRGEKGNWTEKRCIKREKNIFSTDYKSVWAQIYLSQTSTKTHCLSSKWFQSKAGIFFLSFYTQCCSPNTMNLW